MTHVTARGPVLCGSPVRPCFRTVLPGILAHPSRLTARRAGRAIQAGRACTDRYHACPAHAAFGCDAGVLPAGPRGGEVQASGIRAPRNPAGTRRAGPTVATGGRDRSSRAGDHQITRSVAVPRTKVIGRPGPPGWSSGGSRSSARLETSADWDRGALGGKPALAYARRPRVTEEEWVRWAARQVTGPGGPVSLAEASDPEASDPEASAPGGSLRPRPGREAR